ncbi:portal protein [Pleomorphochaeta sp. DL1XJH-081]|uniref:portal protein n=1 Tax=Pleomorphochaeta sp. DL1XJH-081 TaxID=3409690 RepID=UPI003BB6B2FD
MDAKTKRLEELKQSLLNTLSDMENVRRPTEEIRWEACALVKHRTTAFNLGHSKIKSIPLHSNVQVEATNTAVNGIMGYLISQNIRWFNFTTQGKNFQNADNIFGAKDHLELVVSTLLNVFSQCNFYSSTHLATKDAFVQGTSAEFIVDDLKHGAMVYDTIDPQEFYISENDNRRVDTFYRVYEIPARIAYKKWGEKLPEEVKRLIKNNAGHQKIKFLHAIYPRKDALARNGNAIISTRKQYASVHYSYTGDRVFLESGYDEFPVAVHRWFLNGTSPYGSSPVIELAEEIKKLDKMAYLYLMAADKNANPPIFAPEVLKGRLNLNPGGRNYANLAQTGEPKLFPSTLDLNHLANEIQMQTRVIQQSLYSDLFNILMRQDQQRTATEVREIKGEGLVLLSSIIGNMQEEKITPLIMRTYHILRKGGMLPPPPDELVNASKDGQVKVELDGPLAQNMKAYHQTVGITQGMQALAAVMQLNPDSQVNVNFDELIRQAMSANGMPQPIIREKAEVKKIKEQQQKILEQQAQAQQMQAQADAMGKLSHTNGTGAQQMMQGVVGR